MDPEDYRTVQIGVPKFWADKYASEAGKNWDAFYKRNQTNFYKDRHWTVDERTDGFPCLAQQHEPPALLVEAGCGVANSAWPLLAANETLRIFAFDFAPTAIELVRERAERADAGDRVHAFLWDFCSSAISEVDSGQRNGLEVETADFITMIFVLSAVPPERQVQGVRHLAQLLKPGGRILFRDYATGDLAQKRFKSRNRIEDNYFVRQDRTLSYFFDESRIREVMQQVGLVEVNVRRVSREIENRKEGIVMQRVFLQAEFVKAVGAHS